MSPLRIYLDSSDYSVLSDPRKLSRENSETLQELRQLKNECRITIHFSGTLLSEMAPTESHYADMAVRRADLLVELCERNALLSQDRIFLLELRKAAGNTVEALNVYSNLGEWYPEGTGEILPLSEIDRSLIINEVLAEHGANRETRRKLIRKIGKTGVLRHALKNSIAREARSVSLEEILSKYPMRPEDARILSRFVAGDASQDEASQAFENSLRDPRWMMRWFEQNHSQLTPFIEWTRSPAKPLTECLLEMGSLATSLRSQDSVLGVDLSSVLLSSTRWEERQNSLLEKIAARICGELRIETTQHLSGEILDDKCPGLTTAVRSLQSAAWTVMLKTPRKPKMSDFPDAMHAVYAPYVDVFRADSFMAPYISKYATKYGTTIVHRLVDLPAAIYDQLLKRS